jgi:hypothetical protein
LLESGPFAVLRTRPGVIFGEKCRASLLRRINCSSILGAESQEEYPKVLTRELPFEGTGSRFPVVLKIEEALGQSVEIEGHWA